jgi:hypothetical protein
MKKSFPGYYRPTESEFKKLWKDCVFAFDANTLLNVYRYTPRTQTKFLNILQKLKDHIWIPHQAAQEYHSNRLEVIGDQIKAYEKIDKVLENFAAIERGMDEFKRHSYVDIESIKKTLQTAVTKAKDQLQSLKSKHPDYFASDHLRDRITELFDGRVGVSFSKDQLVKLYTEASQRFSQRIPPGFEDAKKDIPQKYGDFILWRQLMDFSSDRKKNIIFITDDRKEDWWLKQNGRTFGPRPELVNEMQFSSGAIFYMYHADQFMDHAQKYLSIPDESDAVQEIKAIRKNDENNAFAALKAFATTDSSILSGAASLAATKSIADLAAANATSPYSLFKTSQYLADLARSISVNAPLFTTSQQLADIARHITANSHFLPTSQQLAELARSVSTVASSKTLAELLVSQSPSSLILNTGIDSPVYKTDETTDTNKSDGSLKIQLGSDSADVKDKNT